MADEEYGIILPFVLVKSADGPYDDDAFVSGWRLGALNVHLSIASASGLMVAPTVLRPIEKHQAELLAMHYGYNAVEEPHDEEWSIFYFVPLKSVEAENLDFGDL